MMTSTPSAERESITIATLNVQGLTAKLRRTLDLCEVHSVDILFVQETFVSPDSNRAVKMAARKAGWTFTPGSVLAKRGGGYRAGVGVLSRWPVQLFVGPAGPFGTELGEGRLMWIKAHRPGQRPMIFANIYLHSGDDKSAAALLDHAVSSLWLSGETGAVVGDYNLTKEQSPVSQYIATGIMRDMDLVGGDESTNTRLDGRAIDYGLATETLAVSSRFQARGVADHDLVGWRLLVQHDAPTYRREACAKLIQEEVSESAWTEVWENTMPTLREHAKSMMQIRHGK